MTPGEKGAAARAGYTRLLRRKPTWRQSRQIERIMKRPDTSVGSFLLELGRSTRYRRALVSRLGDRPELSDADFIAAAYRELLHRKPDRAGLAFYVDQLGRGKGRLQVLDELASSDEHVNRVVGEAYPLPDIRHANETRYLDVPDIDGSGLVPCFVARSATDLEWIGQQITLHDYYDRPGIWGYSVTAEKRVVAEMLSCFAPRRALDLGCSNGVVMKCLHDLGIRAEGVELSKSAIEVAFPEIRDNIHHGDVIDLVGDSSYDLVSGLDIFEHVTPADLDKLIVAISDLMTTGGFLFANIPAFGEDDVFGTVFPYYIDAWRESAGRGELFDLIHVDDQGFPMNGHIIWAASDWWERQFRTHGLTRVRSVEAALHRRYGDFLKDAAPARLAFYAFMKGDHADRAAGVIDRIEQMSEPLPV